MSDLISRQAAIDAFNKQIWSAIDIPICKEIRIAAKKTIEQLPSAQPDIIHLQKEQEYMRGWEDGRKNLMERLPSARPTGRWILQNDKTKRLYGWWFCSECSAWIIGEPAPYCSNCGAKMEVDR